ncbi:MAG: protein kinase [Myxococcota bacterium]|nr:protein kinase [Myxococcota bacterium]MDW8362972.1 serine/threonine-protein kinase [Myxococcales bacterium]
MLDRIGNCRLLGEIGSGGMAVVYKAVQEPLGRIVAVKALKPSIAVDSQFARRFEREAHFMAALQHENILHVYDFVKDGQSMYIVMEYVRGIDLYDLLERTPVLPVDVAAIIALMVARALDYAHFRGIVHRDIKPANVMIGHDGSVKLMDFGIARDETLSDLTETGTGLGTPSYMSPEQILGDKLDFRSDLFSLGIVLYQMITGQKPFVEDASRTVMQKIRLDRYTPPRRLNPAVPRQLERILARCMEKMPANRYPTTQALIDDLTEFLAPRVRSSYQARLVLYLREVGVIADEEAEEILAASGPRSARRLAFDRSVLRHVGIAQALAFVVLLVAGGAIQVRAGRIAGDPEQFAAEGGLPVVPADAGYVEVVADPWAEVWIDGQKVAVTPTAQRIALTPGRHFLRLRNPHFREHERQVIVRSGRVERVEVALEPLRAESAP